MTRPMRILRSSPFMGERELAEAWLILNAPVAQFGYLQTLFGGQKEQHPPKVKAGSSNLLRRVTKRSD